MPASDPGSPFSPEQLSAVLFAASTPLMLTNPRLPDNPIVGANQAFCAMTGYRPEELLGRNCRFMQCAETDRSAVAQLRRAIAAAEPVEVVLLNRKRNGEQFLNRMLVAPVFDAAGSLIYFFANHRDVTAAVQLQATPARLPEARQADVLRECHRAARVVAWDWNLKTGKLRWGEGYEAVIGAASGAAGAAEIAGWLARVHLQDRAGARAGLEAISVDAGRFEYRVECCGEQRWFEAIGRVVARDPAGVPVRAAGIVIDATDRKALPRVAATEQAHAEAAPPRPPEMAVTGQLADGIAHDLNNLFAAISGSLELLEAPLQEGRGADATRYIEAARRAVRRGIGLTSQLPRCEVPEDGSIASSHPQEGGKPATTGVRILVVEDEAALRDLMVEVLTEHGCCVLSAAAAPAALEIIQSEAAVDLLVTDVGLPGLDGRTLADAARALRPALPVLFVTGTEGDGAANPAGMEVIGKPFTLAALLKRVTGMLQGRAPEP